MRFAALFALVACVAVAGVDVAGAQQARPLRPGERIQMRQPSVHAKGVYGGVQPGKPIPKAYENKRPVKNRARRKNRVTWVGFQPRDNGAARVFVQLTSEIAYTQRVEGDTLVVTLERARFGSSNARRFLDTRFFDTALARVDADRARRRGKRGRRARGVEVRVKFKNPADAAQASASMTTNEADGYTYLFLDFGAPSGEASGDDTGEDSE